MARTWSFDMRTPCCKAILIPCPKCASVAGKRCTKPGGYGGLIYRGQCHVARSNAFVKVCALLEAPSMIQEYAGGCAFYTPGLHFATLCEALADFFIRIHAPNQRRVRVSLLDGTVIREWSAKEAQTQPNHNPETCRDPTCDCFPF